VFFVCVCVCVRVCGNEVREVERDGEMERWRDGERERQVIDKFQSAYLSPFVLYESQRTIADFRISRLMIAFSRLRFALVSPGVVWV
jgi:hypothetical protein